MIPLQKNNMNDLKEKKEKNAMQHNEDGAIVLYLSSLSQAAERDEDVK